jgi:hypothetical protein
MGLSEEVGMMHVDIVRNEPENLLQRRVAIAYVDHDEFILKSTWDQCDYVEMVRSMLADAPSATDPLRMLVKCVHGPYLDTTKVHDDASCPFGTRGTRKMRAVKYRDKYAGVDPFAACG